MNEKLEQETNDEICAMLASIKLIYKSSAVFVQNLSKKDPKLTLQLEALCQNGNGLKGTEIIKINNKKVYALEQDKNTQNAITTFMEYFN